MNTGVSEQSELLIVEIDKNILHLRLNRPDKKNAINLDMYRALNQVLRDAEVDNEIRVLVLSGSGEDFTTGNDLADFVAVGESLDPEASPVVEFLQCLGQFSKPVIVAVEGQAIGIGSTLLLHADLIYAHPKACFSLPFVKIGLCPEFSSSYLLPRLIGHAKAFEWLVLGDAIAASEALNHGLINGIEDDPLAKCLERAHQLVSMAPEAVRVSKGLLKQSLAEPVAAASGAELKQFVRLLAGPEFAEAATAFFEKRSPKF